MNALSALNVSAASAARASARRESVAEQQSTIDERRDASRKTAVASAEFAGLLALLAGAGPRVRTELLKQLPAESGALVDRLLDGVGEDTSGEADATGDPGGDESSAMLGNDAGIPQAASDAMRYRGIGDASALSRSGQGTDTTPPAEFSRLSNGALARVAERRIASAQLMALGDTQGADARAALDSLLERAGTEAGVLLSTLADSDMTAAAAIAATESAGTRPSGAIATDVSTPVRDAGALVPEFRTRLERVIARMKEEYGHSVELVETTRSQERQDFLFAQGRTRPGPVVTWTQDSAHTRGAAADVTIDGAWSNAEGFARLQRIAREEGLRTLGVRDPGHLELPRDARQAESMLGGAAQVSARVENVATYSGRAATSPVASVAGVAGVAGVARVADTSASPVDGAPGAGSPASILAAARVAAANASNGSGGNTGNDAREERGARPRSLGYQRTESMEPSPTAAAFGTTGAPASGATGGTGNTGSTGAAAAPSAGSAQRATDAQDLRESAPSSLTRLTMSMDGDSDGRITIDLRGRTVGTHITTDAATADGLRARTAELQDALGRHGLETDTVRISTAGRAEAAEPRALNAERDALKLAGAGAGTGSGATGDGTTNSGPNGGRERSPTAREWEKQEDARREHAQRARDQEKEQDARRRGQQRNYNEDPR